MKKHASVLNNDSNSDSILYFACAFCSQYIHRISTERRGAVVSTSYSSGLEFDSWLRDRPS